MEQYGFVYIWYDRKHKRYYIGSHWGYEDDGYICSSRWMKQAYKHRPHDFRRRIITKIYTNRDDLFTEEHKWLQQIKPEELKGHRYYNLRNHRFRHWMANKNQVTIREKISKATKEAMWRPEVRKKYLANMDERTKRSHTPEANKKRTESIRQAYLKKHPPELRKKHMKFNSDEYVDFMINHSREMWKNRTTDEKKQVGQKISKTLKEKYKHTCHPCKGMKGLGKGLRWWNNGSINTRAKECPDGFVPGMLR